MAVALKRETLEAREWGQENNRRTTLAFSDYSSATILLPFNNRWRIAVRHSESDGYICRAIVRNRFHSESDGY